MADEHLNQYYEPVNQQLERNRLLAEQYRSMCEHNLKNQEHGMPIFNSFDTKAWDASVKLDERDRQRGYTLLWIVAGFIGGYLLAMLT